MGARLIQIQSRKWFLEGLLPGAQQSVRVLLYAFPFRVGRSPELSLPLSMEAVSWNHAELFEDATGLYVKDLGSTNGTWLNGERVRDSVPVRVGDLLQFATVEFLVGEEVSSRAVLPTMPGISLASDDSESPRLLRAMLRDRAVRAVFQPIVDSQSATVVAYEALGRADGPGLPKSVHVLFSLATRIGVDAELSHVFRERAVEETTRLPSRSPVFLNCHPAETHSDALLREFSRISSLYPERRFVLEVHEAAITDPPRMRALSEQLADIGVGLAYDDFGAGQARLAELAEAPPDYLKFDRSLVHDIDLGPVRRQQMVGALVKMARDLGVVPLAEGIEREGEARMCRDLGFTLAQGFYFGKPQPAEAWSA